MGKAGIKRVDLMCPGFTGDCLETLEEINMEARHAFIEAGGETFGYIDCLNDSPAWGSAMADLSISHMGGWPCEAKPDAKELAASRAAALAIGATQ